MELDSAILSGVVIRFALRLLGRLLLLSAVLVSLFATFQWLTWPAVGELAKRDPATTAFIARYARTAGGPAPEWRWVPYSQISAALKHAVIAAEDQEFFSHRGFSVHEIRTAVAESVRQGKPLRGASTITQQLAKNLWLEPSRNPWRKVKEALLTHQLERSLEKRRILELYLNVVELGPGVYGAEAAARRYFGKSAAALEPAEAAALAAALPRPSRWHPGSTDPVYQARARRIGQRMAASSWILSHL